MYTRRYSISILMSYLDIVFFQWLSSTNMQFSFDGFDGCFSS